MSQTQPDKPGEDRVLKPEDFFDLTDEFVATFFDNCDYVWQVIDKIAVYVNDLVGKKQTILGEVMPGAYISQRPIYIGQGARIEPGAYVVGPAYIGAGVVVRHGAFVRDNVILLAGSLLGHASECKNSLLLPGASAPHFNYVGDSILGHRVNLGAGTKLSNLGILSQKDPVTKKRPSIKLTVGEKTYDTGLAKMGAVLGDDVQTGCNAVLNPGCVVGQRTLIYANLSLPKGYYSPDQMIKLRQKIESDPRR